MHKWPHEYDSDKRTPKTDANGYVYGYEEEDDSCPSDDYAQTEENDWDD